MPPLSLFPTLCDLAGVKIPDALDGKSLVPLMKNPSATIKDFAVSQYPRGGNKEEAKKPGFSSKKSMGYSIRTGRYRYTVWMGDDFRSTQPFNKDLIVGTELYDYQTDPDETVNVADDKNYATVSKEMYEKMIAFFKTQVK